MKQNKAIILIVDDNDMFRSLSKLLLEANGYEVIEESGGIHALSTYQKRENEIDIVLLDYLMPEMNGRELFDSIKAINPDAKIIICTGFCADGETDKMIADGAAQILLKPFRHTELFAVVEEALKQA